MIRVCTVTIEGYDQPFKIRSLTCAEAEVFVNEGREMVEKQAELKPQEWLDRMIRTVQKNLVDLPDNFNIREELDLASVKILYDRIQVFSGLRTGEVEAASPSPKSEAA